MFRRQRPTRLDDRRNPNGDGVVGDIANHYGIGADMYMITDADIAKQDCAGADVDIVADLRSAGFFYSGESDHHTVADAAIIAKTGKTADDDAA